ncbi:MAG TPA: hypothetical protein VLE97_06110 [Gaiellaceae bacterium]|nr:hypothetical protein [Gaiellaceae bacterium]
MKHVPTSSGSSICTTDGTVEQVVDATRAVFCYVDCPSCLRRAIAETDARGHVLRELLEKLETLS